MKKFIFIMSFMLGFTTLAACGGSGATSSGDDDNIAIIEPSTSDDIDTETTEDTESDESIDASEGTINEEDDELYSETCDNSADDDADGYVDCDDSDCDGESACAVAETESVCDDSLDDEGDGYADCDDSDCSTNENCADADADGFSLAASDCDDGDATSYPGASETYDDGIDQDCDGTDATTAVDLTDIDTANPYFLWVSPSGTDTGSDGSFANPYRNIQTAVNALTSDLQTILVMEGRYTRGFRVLGTSTRVYGGVYEDTSDGSSVWKADATSHPSRLNLSTTQRVLFADSGDGLNEFSGFTIIASAFQQDIVVQNASITLATLTMVSADGTADSDNDTASLVGVTYDEAGEYELNINRSLFRRGDVTVDGATDLEANLISVDLAHADATADISVYRNRFVTGEMDMGAATTGSLGLKLEATADSAALSELDITGNTFAMDGGMSGSIAASVDGAFTGFIDGNSVTQAGGSQFAFGLVFDIGDVTTLESDLFITDNLVVMGDEAELTTMGIGIMTADATNARFAGNTVVINETVETGYNIAVTDVAEEGLVLDNNILVNRDGADNAQLYIVIEGSFPGTVTVEDSFFSDVDEWYLLNGSITELPSDTPELSVTINDGSATTTYTTEADLEAAYPGIFEFSGNTYDVDPEFDDDYAPQAEAAQGIGY